MNVTIIGAMSIILSFIAIIKKNDNMLLKLVVIFSIFTASIAIDSFLVILPFEIPMVLWIIKQLIYFIKKRKELNYKNLREEFNKNKIMKAFIFIIITIITSEIYLYLSKINYAYIDNVYHELRYISFRMINITQAIRVITYFVFAIILSLRINSKKEIEDILKTFAYSTLFAAVWGIIQYILFFMNVNYPAFLFNNNPYAAQGYEQMIQGIKRITSIGTEPSVFAINLSVFLPIALQFLLKKREKNEAKCKIFLNIMAVLIIVCMIMTTSATAVFSLTIIFIILLLYYFISYIKNEKDKYYKECIIKIILYSIISIIVALILCYASSKYTSLTSQNDLKDNNETVENVYEKNRKIKEETVDAIKEMTVNKLDSGSGQERLQREKDGIRFFRLSPIFGIGYFSYRTFSLFTNALVNMGILGLFAVVYLFYIVIKQIIINRKKDKEKFLLFLLCVIGMCIAYLISIPDFGYIYCWIILVCAYKYFDCEENKMDRKENLIIGVDARALDENRTGISTYIDKIIEQFNNIKDKNIKFILYSTRDIKLSFNNNENIIIKEMKEYKKGVIFTRYILPKILKQDNVDIFWGTQHLLPIRNQYTKNIKYVLTVHDLAIHKLKTVGSIKNTIIHKLFFKKSCKSADAIISVSESTKSDIVEIFNINPKKIKTVYLGRNCEKEYKVSKENEDNILKKFDVQNKNFIFFVSTIEPRKNIITIIKAFNDFKDKNKNNDIKLILAGGLGWKYENIIKEIDNSKYKKDINLAGYISNEEKSCLLHNSKCFVYPSLYEGFGMPILEAFQSGTVVITSNVSSMPEVGGKAAFYLEKVEDEIELSTLMNKVLSLNNKEKEDIIKKGYEQADQFTWEKCSNETLNIIKSLAEN